MEKKALGKGLSALIPPKEVTREASADTGESIVYVVVSDVRANKYQPRSDFNEEKLEELINSIKAKGVVQPILVRSTPQGYELIAGERRLRAVKMLGIEKIPAIVKDADDLSMLELALIENLQREDLNPIEEAKAYQKFLEDFAFTQERISQVLGKDRSTVANMLRLLSLPKKIQEYISDNSLTAGHGKAILSLPSEQAQLRVGAVAVKRGLSVRETENLVAKRMGPHHARATQKDSNVAALEDELRRLLGTRVRIVRGKKRGKIEIEYYSREDMERILDLLRAKAGSQELTQSP
jgi:ParB family chromosome partitioning protein